MLTSKPSFMYGQWWEYLNGVRLSVCLSQVILNELELLTDTIDADFGLILVISCTFSRFCYKNIHYNAITDCHLIECKTT